MTVGTGPALAIKAFLSLSIFGIQVAAGQVSVEGIGLEYGSYQVGFQHYNTADSSRSYQRSMDWSHDFIPRTIPVSLWYPARQIAGPQEQMTVLDYMEIMKEEEEWEFLPNDHILNWFQYPNTASNSAHLEKTTTAVYHLSPLNHKFPAVVYAPGYQASSIENFLLCEYLASHGYVVISSPSRGTENRWLTAGTAMDMETQARDIEFLIAKVMNLPYVDPEKISTVGFSFGGLSNVLSQMRNKYIKAVVSLDGSIKYRFATLRSSPFYDISKMDVPFIHMAQKDIPEVVLKEDGIDAALNHRFDFYDSLKYSQAYQLKFHNLTHPYFSILGILFQTRDPRQDKSDREIMESYKWVAMYTLNFLDAFLKNSESGLKLLGSHAMDLGTKKSLISLRSKVPEDNDFDFQDFNALALQQKYKDLGSLYANIEQNFPGLKLPESTLNNLGLQLVFNPETSAQGINVFLFALSLYPDSANLYDSLAEGYLSIGDLEKARSNFEKSLNLYPENQNAKNRLKELNQ